jgi:tRNA-splicing ligase RtcB (3'-phosphate/5'-hydroxy nucleic acid ligase)
MSKPLFEVIDAGNGKIIKAWKRGVQFEPKAIEQLQRTAQLPFIFRYLAAMPDTHWGMGATVGSVLPTKGAIVPSAVGVDIGCGMAAVKFPLRSKDLYGTAGDDRDFRANLVRMREVIEMTVPTGRTDNGGVEDIGSWRRDVPEEIQAVWDGEFQEKYEALCSKHQGMRSQNTANHLATLGTGNHFIEISVDDNDFIWLVLHTGSRGMGNRIGTYFTKLAKDLCHKWFISLPDPDLAYLPENTPEFGAYMGALHLAQTFAWKNRELMIERIKKALIEAIGNNFQHELMRVHCHHNYAAHEKHFGQDIIVTRKGAVRAGKGDLGIIPGSMGARSYIVRGLGSSESFESCSHGAGRSMGREEAKRTFTVEDHIKATEGIECHKGAEVLDETPGAYKPIEAVMAAQSDLVEVVCELRQLVSIKGLGDEGPKYKKKR